MAVDFSLVCSLSLFCFCSVRVFFSFRLDVVHTFLLPGVSVRCGIESMSVAPSHRYSGTPSSRIATQIPDRCLPESECGLVVCVGMSCYDPVSVLWTEYAHEVAH